MNSSLPRSGGVGERSCDARGIGHRCRRAGDSSPHSLRCVVGLQRSAQEDSRMATAHHPEAATASLVALQFR